MEALGMLLFFICITAPVWMIAVHNEVDESLQGITVGVSLLLPIVAVGVLYLIAVL